MEGGVGRGNWGLVQHGNEWGVVAHIGTEGLWRAKGCGEKAAFCGWRVSTGQSMVGETGESGVNSWIIGTF